MKTTKSSRDRLSELPDSLIFDIFWLLPMRDVVRTTILSNRWKNLWATAPCLNFEYGSSYGAADRVRNFVNRALMLWKGIKIQNFKIDFGYLFDNSLFSDIDLWVRFAKENEVEELYLYLRYDDCIMGGDVDAITRTHQEMYSAPQCLYSCSSLKKLSLIDCNLKIHGNVQWSHLKSLTIDCFFITENVINQVLCGSPQLEVFSLSLMEYHENLNIQSSSLKKLVIDKFFYIQNNDPSKVTELRIWSPKLEMLEILGVPCSKCFLINVSSLTHATLGFYGPDFRYHKKVIGEALRQILPSIQHVEKVTLSDWCVKMLAAMKKKCLLSPLSNVKFLKLERSSVDYKQIVGLLEIFPKLKMLALHGRIDGNERVRESHEFERNLPKSFMRQLRTVEVIWCESDNSIFPFIEIVLKYARKLEKMVFRVEEIRPPSSSLYLASQKLLRMPRSSPTAKLIFCEY